MVMTDHQYKLSIAKKKGNPNIKDCIKCEKLYYAHYKKQAVDGLCPKCRPKQNTGNPTLDLIDNSSLNKKNLDKKSTDNIFSHLF